MTASCSNKASPTMTYSSSENLQSLVCASGGLAFIQLQSFSIFLFLSVVLQGWASQGGPPEFAGFTAPKSQSVQIQADRAFSSKSCASKPQVTWPWRMGTTQGRRFGCRRLILASYFFLCACIFAACVCHHFRLPREPELQGVVMVFFCSTCWPCLRAHNLSHLLKPSLRRKASEDFASGKKRKVAWQGAGFLSRPFVSSSSGLDVWGRSLLF